MHQVSSCTCGSETIELTGEVDTGCALYGLDNLEHSAILFLCDNNTEATAAGLNCVLDTS